MKNAWIVGLALSFACGSDASGSTASGVSGSKKVSDLTVKEMQAVCRSFVDMLESAGTASQWCTWDAALDTTTKTACESERDACITDYKADNAADAKDGTAACNALTSDDLTTDCDATVAQMEKCFKDNVSEQLVVVKQASCSRPGEAQEEADVAASCKLVPDACFPAALDKGRHPQGPGPRILAR